MINSTQGSTFRVCSRKIIICILVSMIMNAGKDDMTFYEVVLNSINVQSLNVSTKLQKTQLVFSYKPGHDYTRSKRFRATIFILREVKYKAASVNLLVNKCIVTCYAIRSTGSREIETIGIALVPRGGANKNKTSENRNFNN